MLTIYKASAGSGKTYTLAKTYIYLLLWRPKRSSSSRSDEAQMMEINLDNENQKHEPNRHRSILAITFTRKATEEMKHRIMDELSILSKVTPETAQDVPYARDFIKEYGCTPQQLAAASSLALQELLFDYHNFNVSTIDAFFQRVLQAFARELDMQADYRVELNDKLAMQNAVGVMLDQFNSSSQGSTSLEDWLYNLMRTFVAEGKKGNFFNRKSGMFGDLVGLISQIGQETFKEFHDDMLEYIQTDQLDVFSKALDIALSEIPAQVQSLANKAILSYGIDLDWMPRVSKIRKMCEAFLKGEMPTPNDWDNNNVTSLIKNQEVKVFNKGKGSDEALETVRQLFLDIYKLAAKANDLTIIKSSLMQLGLLKYVWGILIKLNQENNTLLISDTNMLVSKIIAEDDAPFVYEKMGVHLKHFLIDEFQDTSRMQWQNLRPLVANGQSIGGNSLIIGDEKQSIYRFRNSDSSILHSQVLKDFTNPATGEPTTKIEIKGQVPSENTNHRSSETVVRFNNTLFDLLAKRNHIQGFENVMQQVKLEYENYKGYVSIRFNVDAQKDKAENECDDASLISLEKDEKELVFHEMAAEILRQHNEGEYRWRDIAILLNTNKEATKVVNFLARNYPQITMMSDEALKISSSSAVQLIISLLSLIDQEESDSEEDLKEKKYLTRREIQGIINRFEFHYSHGMKKFGLEYPTEEERRDLSDYALQQALADSNNSNIELYQHINAIRTAKPTTLVALVETILEAQFSPAERNNQLPYIMAFQDVVINFCEEQDGSLHSFLEWWKSNSDRQHVQGAAEADAVRVMTLHGSKGLEFHCVHIPLCTWPLKWHPSLPPTLWVAYPPELKQVVAAPNPPSIFLPVKKDIKNPYSLFKGIFEQEEYKALVDTINKTYVAFTRARSELMVWCVGKLKDGTIDTDIFKAFSDFIPNPEANYHLTMNLAEGWDSEKKRFQIGIPTFFAITDPKKAKEMAKKKDSVQQNPKPQDLYPVQYRADVAALLKLDDLLDISQDIDDDSAMTKPMDPEDYEEEDIRQEGLLMHEIMSQIIVNKDLELAISRVSERKRLEQPLIEKCRNIIERFVGSQTVRGHGWFSGDHEVLVEQPIYIPSQGFTKRPDRIMLDRQGGATVIDYKFVTNPKRYKAESHIQQLQEYMGLLRDMGYSPISGYLCYPRLKKIAQVSMK